MAQKAVRSVLCLWCLWLASPVLGLAGAESPLPIKTVFVIMMENHDWSTIIGTTNCLYINHSLLPVASYCSQYYNPPTNHPSEPNYIWLEAGTNFGILNDSPTNRITSTNHLVTLLHNAGISWKSYQEDITATTSPLTNQLDYVVRHNPMVLFTDVDNNPAYLSSHVRPYTEFATDLQNNTVARYNFITPDLTNDMHNAVCSGCSSRVSADYWLSHEVPKILASQAYADHGALFITWDEGANDTSDGPIGMIVLSPWAKGHGYSNTVHYTHSSTLRTMQNIFGVRPYLGDAAKAADLSDLFVTVHLTSAAVTNGTLWLNVTNVVAGRAHYLEAATNLADWVPLHTNVPPSSTSTIRFSEPAPPDNVGRFYRVRLGP